MNGPGISKGVALRPPLFMMTTQRWFIVVAVVAVVIWGEQTRRRWESHRSKYQCYRYAEELYRDCENEVLVGCGMSPPSEEAFREWKAGKSARRDHSLRIAEYYARLKMKYDRAMLRPWETVPDDPSPPPDP
jgi:hypothetical protein